MRSWGYAVLCLLSWLAGTLCAALSPGRADAATAVMQEFHIAPEGDDLADGSADHPFRSLTRAREAVRAINQSMSDDIIVHFGDGSYFLEEPLVFTPADSGSNGHDLIYRARGDGAAVLSGGALITDWRISDAERNIWSAPVEDGHNFRQLYVNGRRALRARSDAGLPAGARKTETGYTLPTDAMSTWRNQRDIEFVYRVEWRAPRCFVQVIEGNAITMQQPGWSMANSWGIYMDVFNVDLPVRIENAYELLDQPGEWYLDRSEGRLYYMPRPGEDMALAEIVAPRLETLLRLEGTSAAPVRNIRFEGITFADANWLIGDRSIGYQPIYVMVTGAAGSEATSDTARMSRQSPAHIQLIGVDQIDFHRNTFTRLGGIGMEFRHAASNCEVIGNEFHTIAGAGIQMGDMTRQRTEDPREAVSKILVENNYIHDIGLEYPDGPGISLFFTQDVAIRHNEFSHLPYSAVSVGWGWGRPEQQNGPTLARGNRVEMNHIHNHMLVQSDGSAIYTTGGQPGLIIQGNHIHDSGARISPGIYLDRGSRGVTVVNNVVHDTECNMMIKGTDQTIRHNFWQEEHSTRRPAPTHYVYWGVDSLLWREADNHVIMDQVSMPASIIRNAGLQPEYQYLSPPARPLDFQAPTAPTGVSSPAQTDVTVDLAWNASVDDVETTGYEIWRDGQLVAAGGQTRQRISGLVPDREYTFEVRARDRAANLSPPSEPLRVRTRPASANLALNCPAYGFDLSFAGNSWNPSTHHNYIRQATGHSAAKAVDGDPDSFAMPLMEKFAWMLQVDLGEKLPLDRLTLHFAKDPMGNPLYATRFEVLVSNNIDEEVWESMGEVENQDPSQATVDLKGVEARHLRIRSIKPDGPRQTGGIMAVSELEVFGR